MTKPTISDDEVFAIAEAVWGKGNGYVRHPQQAENIRLALSDFLARRVPDAMETGPGDGEGYLCKADGFNACRDIVLSLGL